VGVGWNLAELEALGENFKNRGKRVEEQIAVMRELWTKEIVAFEGQWHHITDAGINPLPRRRPIPIWMGGESDVDPPEGRAAGGRMDAATSNRPGGILPRSASRGG
jgi:alkanesulfonate monooxygenase SsuD/methylene tetrahydromethanopterin reductase-like flavin-dependent oxidoreductase (luciferase family)